MRLVAALILAFLAPATPAFAHADILERLAYTDAAIAASPDDPMLYLRRGELHRLHGDRAAAEADYAKADAIAPDLADTLFFRGRLLFEFGDPSGALIWMDRYLTIRPDHADALIIRARCRARTGAREGAVGDLDRAISLLPSPTPELYLERAAMQSGEAALVGLDEALERLGPVVTLVRPVIEAALAAGRPDAALERLGLLPAGIANTPIWLNLRGDLLVETGAPANAVYRQALAAIDAQPVARRNREAMRKLVAELEAKIAAEGG